MLVAYHVLKGEQLCLVDANAPLLVDLLVGEHAGSRMGLINRIGEDNDNPLRI
jgi:hypothetical protein